MVFHEYKKRPDNMFKEGYEYENTTMKCTYEGNGGKDWYTGDNIRGSNNYIRISIPIKTRSIRVNSNNRFAVKKENTSVEKEPGTTGYRPRVMIGGKVIK